MAAACDTADVADVAIVGFGPVGQTLAILLGQRGRRVVVLEKQPAAYPLPRAVHFDHEVARILQAAGLGDALRAGRRLRMAQRRRRDAAPHRQP